MKWTASQVWDLVKGWPEEARESEIVAYDSNGNPPTSPHYDPPVVEWYGNLNYHDRINPAHAAALHVASGLEWLMEHGDPLLYRDGSTRFVAMRNGPTYCGPSALHAVSVAVMAVGGEE